VAIAPQIDTVRLDSVSAAGFDAVIYPGRHGRLRDLVNDARSLVAEMARTERDEARLRTAG
jgi:putative intracellular protease/amidase